MWSIPATILVSALLEEAYLDLIREDCLRGRPLAKVKEAELVPPLKREAGIFDEGPNLEAFCDAVEGAEGPSCIRSYPSECAWKS